VELCTEYGWCLRAGDREALLAAKQQDRETLADASIRSEFGDATVDEQDKRSFLLPILDDWLFDSAGRGARSGLPL
jgi:hypothetical protein